MEKESKLPDVKKMLKSDLDEYSENIFKELQIRKTKFVSLREFSDSQLEVLSDKIETEIELRNSIFKIVRTGRSINCRD